MIGYKSVWFGKEVEGRFTDVETMFVSDFNALLQGNVTTKPVAHVYICSPATKQLVNND